MTRFGIRHLSFALGDEKVWYRDLPNIEERIRTLDLPDEEELWNWGYCRRSSGDYDSHVAHGLSEAAGYISAAGIDVDVVLACGPFQNSTERFVDRISAELPKIDIDPGRVRPVHDRDCANVLQAVADAGELIRAGAKNVL